MGRPGVPDVMFYSLIDGYRRLASLHLLIRAIVHAAASLRETNGSYARHASFDRLSRSFCRYKVNPADARELWTYMCLMAAGKQAGTSELQTPLGRTYVLHAERVDTLLGDRSEALPKLQSLFTAICATPMAVACVEDGARAYTALNADPLAKIKHRRRFLH
jgi:hypothetical protein